MSPKFLLKFRGCNSDLEDFGAGLRFHKVIEDQHPQLVADSQVRKVVYCSGQVYYNLEAKREKDGHNDVAIVRVEQLAPFPFKSLDATAKRFPNAE
jgi:2-oxoglutarate dehydrogenase E1 component